MTSSSDCRPSSEIPLGNIQVQDGFWFHRQQLNIKTSLFHQWAKLEETGRLDNFRKAAGNRQGNHEGFFYNDSDVHKWAEAGFISLADTDNPELCDLLNQYVEIVVNAQEPDGYLFTYNQLNFPGQRWINLQIEHELYTLGHFIEAGIAAHLHADNKVLFDAVLKTADLITSVFLDASPLQTPGHQEIEIALIRLYRVTRQSQYLEMGRQFLEKRGRTPVFGFHLLRQFINQVSRSGEIAGRDDSNAENRQLGFDIAENLSGREPRFIGLRSNIQFLTGKYHQQHRPIRKMTKPVGHAVRWAYLQTAVAMLYRETEDASLLPPLEESWENMVREKMYVTGGIGSLPVIEGFGRPYELDNEFAYAETCAAIACIFWNWQMTLATGKARYAELAEWQLYNAASVGIARSGKAYLYRNPLLSRIGLTRKAWFGTACCPGNIARLWAQVAAYTISTEPETLLVHQYISTNATLHIPHIPSEIKLDLVSQFPWDGTVSATLSLQKPERFTVKLRIPGWADHWQVTVDGKQIDKGTRTASPEQTAGGYSPFESHYLQINQVWEGRTTIEMTCDMPVIHHSLHPKTCPGISQTALSRGPIVYCLEDIDNPDARVPNASLDLDHPVEFRRLDTLFADSTLLQTRDLNETPLLFIPYFLWANREPSAMQVFAATSSH